MSKYVKLINLVKKLRSMTRNNVQLTFIGNTISYKSNRSCITSNDVDEVIHTCKRDMYRHEEFLCTL